MSTRLPLGTVLLLVSLACANPVEPPAPSARFCGMTRVTVPIVIDGVPYTQTLLIPKRCADTTERAA